MVKPLFADDSASAAVTTLSPAVLPAVDLTRKQDNPLTTGPVKSPLQTLGTRKITDADIDSIGDKYAGTLSKLSTQMLNSVRASDADQFGKALNDLVLQAKGMDPQGLNKKGLLSRITNLFGSVKEHMLAQYQTVEKRIDELVGQVDKYALTQTSRITDLEDMFVVNYQSHQGLEQEIARASDMKQLVGQDIDQAKTLVNPDAFIAQQIADMNNKFLRLEKKIDDLKRLELLAKQAAPEIRLLQDNARTLVDKFKNIKELTLPAWKQAFTLYLVQLEQKAAAQLANSVDDATNAAFKMQADMLRQNTQDIAKAKQRSVVDLDTLQHVQEQLLGAFDDMEKIAQDGRKARQDAEPKIKALEQQLITRFTKTSN